MACREGYGRKRMQCIAIDPTPLVEKAGENEFIYINQYYKGCNEEVIDFIRRYDFLLPVLIKAPGEIYRIFPRDDINLEFDLHHDPEEDYDELFVVIKSPYAPQKARALMDRLGDEWFLHIMCKTKNKLCITEEPL